MLEGHAQIYLFAVYSAIIWLLWLIKVILSSRYRPYTEDYSPSTSVVVPVVDEPLDLFRDVIGRMVEQSPGEIIVVINGAENPGLVEVCEEFAPLVQWTHTPIPGKRNAVMIGTKMSTGDITVLVDSDTVWTPGTLSELVKPFKDQRVGGVTTRQRILEPERSWITRWADWLENSRALYSMPAQSVIGQIGCLPGRTIAFRRSILMRVMHKFMTERFLGVFLEVSDDRTLTNLTLKEGYRTVYQYTSLVYTDAPLKVKKLFKQQLRWARGSQYNTLRMLPWMITHAPLLAFFFVLDIALPFMLFAVVGGWIFHAFTHEGQNLYEGILHHYGFKDGVIMVVGLMVLSSVVSMGIRQMRHLSEKPSDFFRLPMFIIVSTFFLMPIRLIGFFRMGHASGWGTRAGAYAGGDMGTENEANLREPEPGGAAAPALVGAGMPGAAAAPGFASSASIEGPRSAAPSPTAFADPEAAGDRAFTDLFGPVLADAAPALDAPAQIRPRYARETKRTSRPRRHYNMYAAIPYLIGIAILSLEAIFIV
jgi:hyaluronan synthase